VASPASRSFPFRPLGVSISERTSVQVLMQLCLLAGLQHHIEPVNRGHRKNDVAVLAAHVQIAQYVIGDAPNEICDPGQLAVFHAKPFSTKVRSHTLLAAARCTSSAHPSVVLTAPLLHGDGQDAY